MSIFKNNLRLSRSSVPSDARPVNSGINNLICATILAGLVLFSGGAKATNVLLNPGAETGDLSSWHQSLTGYMFVVSTNGFVPSTTNENFLAHSGKYTFQLFNTTANSSFIYQDFAADPGSQWSASCYAICYASNYFSSGATAHLQVVFYDSSNNVVPYPSAAGGVYTSAFLDPNDFGGEFSYVIFPPMAVDASGWLFLQATNLNDQDPGTEGTEDAALVSLPLTAPAGTAFVRYQLEFDNLVTGGGDVYFDDCDLEKITGSDPDITNAPVAVTTFASASASFTVGTTHNPLFTGEKVTFQWRKNGTNLPAAGGVNDISSTTTAATLSFTNLQGADSGLFDVIVTSKSAAFNYTNSIRSVPVPLTVLTESPLQKANALGVNAGFESAPVWPIWNIFNGCNFASAANFYDTANTVPVNVLDGNEVAIIGSNGDRDNGFYAQVPAAPGSLWKAGGWAYISSLNDFVAGNTCRLQVWFLNSVGGPATPGTPTYESFKMYGLGYTNSDAQYVSVDTSSPNNGQTLYHTQLPRDQWCFLPVTNVVNNGGIGLEDDIPYTTITNGYFTVPTNSAGINFQVYEYCPQSTDTPTPQADLGGSASDAVYWDDMQLFQVLPVTNLTASVSGGNVNLSFSAGAGLSYAVLYKTNLTDVTWNVLSNNIAAPLSWQTNITVTATTYPITIADHVTTRTRFYRIQSQ